MSPSPIIIAILSIERIMNMSFEINILVVDQEKPLHLPFSSSIFLENEVESEVFARYFDIWPFLCNTKGVFYSLGQLVDDGWYSALPICDADFDMEVPKDRFPFWISEEFRDNFAPFTVFEEFYDDFVAIIKFLLFSSPRKTIMFLTRYQCEDNEVIIGTLRLEQFFDMLNRKEILFNTCYIISELDERSWLKKD